MENFKNVLFIIMCVFILFVVGWDLKFTYEYREVMQYFEANPVQKWIMEHSNGVGLSLYIRVLSVTFLFYVLYKARFDIPLLWTLVSFAFVVHMFLFFKLYECSEILRGINAYIHIPMFFV